MEASISTPLRTCTKCGLLKPLTPEQFRPDQRYAEGLKTLCRDCENVWRRAHRRDHLEEARAKGRLFYWRHRERIEQKLLEAAVPVPDTEWAWLAGFVDGEGTINARITLSRTGTPSLHWRLTIANTNELILRHLQERHGGKVYGRANRSERHRPVFTWYLGGRDAVDVVMGLLPYLRAKRRQAEIALELAKLPFRYGSRGRMVDPEVLVQREVLVAELVQLNRRGA